jgi:hypothetical protein
MSLSLPGARQAWKHDRFLSFANAEFQSGTTLARQAEWIEASGEAKDHQHGQSADLRYRASELKAEGKCSEETVHRQVKYLNNVIEADHGKLKQLIRPVQGFKTLKTAYATIARFEVIRALRKGQAAIFNLT